MNAKTRLTRARVQMILKEPFFGTLAMGLRLLEDKSIPTAATNGRDLKYNPDYINSVDDEVLKSVVAHETLHCAFGTFWRAGERDPLLWNAATDYVNNLILEKNGFKIPVEKTHGLMAWLIDKQYEGMSAEEVYAKLKQTVKKIVACGMVDFAGAAGKKGKGEGEGKDGKDPGGCMPDGPGSGSKPEDLERKWKRRVARASAASKHAGKGAVGCERYIEDLLDAKVDWRQYLAQWITSTTKSDYRMLPPAKKSVATGFIFPSMFGRGVGKIVIALDTSGSVGEAEMRMFLSEVKGIFETFDDFELHIIACEDEIPDDGYTVLTPFEEWDKIRAVVKGYGGTSFIPVFEFVEAEQINPRCLIYFTDGFGPAPEQEPGYPVLWCLTPNHQSQKFGQEIVVDLEA